MEPAFAAARSLSRFPYKITSFRWIHLIYRAGSRGIPPRPADAPEFPSGACARKGRAVRHSLTAGVISNLWTRRNICTKVRMSWLSGWRKITRHICNNIQIYCCYPRRQSHSLTRHPRANVNAPVAALVFHFIKHETDIQHIAHITFSEQEKQRERRFLLSRRNAFLMRKSRPFAFMTIDYAAAAAPETSEVYVLEIMSAQCNFITLRPESYHILRLKNLVSLLING